MACTPIRRRRPARRRGSACYVLGQLAVVRLPLQAVRQDLEGYGPCPSGRLGSSSHLISLLYARRTAFDEASFRDAQNRVEVLCASPSSPASLRQPTSRLLRQDLRRQFLCRQQAQVYQQHRYDYVGCLLRCEAEGQQAAIR